MAIKRVFVAGHRGMVGSAIVRVLTKRADVDIVTRGRDELDLLDQSAVRGFFDREGIDEVYLAAARVGGIHANNTYPAEFILQNLQIQNHVIASAHKASVKKLLFLGSSCIYPKMASQPMTEDCLLTAPLEPTNEPYALAKIAGIKMCESFNRQYGTDYRSVMPTNLYGPGDNFHPDNAHVIPALIRRFNDAAESAADQIVIWGSGSPKREFLYVDDMAEACVRILEIDSDLYRRHCEPRMSHINIGTGVDCSIAELAQSIAEISGFKGKIVFDTSKPDGPPRKLLDVSLAAKLGWSHRVNLRKGLEETYHWYRSQELESIRQA